LDLTSAVARDLSDVADHVGVALIAVRGGRLASDILISRELLKIGNRKYGASPIGNFYVLLFLCPKLFDQF
jgi:hypothetical protein